jgi:hypothetical protein
VKTIIALALVGMAIAIGAFSSYPIHGDEGLSTPTPTPTYERLKNPTPIPTLTPWAKPKCDPSYPYEQQDCHFYFYIPLLRKYGSQ